MDALSERRRHDTITAHLHIYVTLLPHSASGQSIGTAARVCAATHRPGNEWLSKIRTQVVSVH
eukprot:6172982-Pleurochrysis_carterae.AAC.2